MATLNIKKYPDGIKVYLFRCNCKSKVNLKRLECSNCYSSVENVAIYSYFFDIKGKGMIPSVPWLTLIGIRNKKDFNRISMTNHWLFEKFIKVSDE